MKCLKKFQTVFWDFDGVIKDSVEVKSHAYCDLFSGFSNDVLSRLKLHHTLNGGISRFEKIPLYLEWAGMNPSRGTVDEYCSRFGELVKERVVNAAWVPGAEELLRKNPWRQLFILVSATPDDELKGIIDQLGLADCFAKVYGASIAKSRAIQESIETYGLVAGECLMVGDAKSDYEAALANGVPFLLRRHALNAGVFENYEGLSVTDFSGMVNGERKLEQ